jgi:hypothetical protein
MYIGERRTTFAKAYGIKVRCYLELFGKHVRTWELFASPHPLPPPPAKKKKTCMKSRLSKWKVNTGQSTLQPNHNLKTTAPPPHTHKEKKGGPFIPCTSHWLHGNYIPKIALPLFWPRLIALPKDTFPILVMHTAQGIPYPILGWSR